MNNLEREQEQKFQKFMSVNSQNPELLKRKYGKHWRTVIENISRKQAIAATARSNHGPDCSCCGM
jgi:hypothetical protein